jgi:hypothetical protein
MALRSELRTASSEQAAHSSRGSLRRDTAEQVLEVSPYQYAMKTGEHFNSPQVELRVRLLLWIASRVVL